MTFSPRGSSFTTGGGNYFVLHKDVKSELAEATSLTFLGMSIDCAKVPQSPAGEVDARPAVGRLRISSHVSGLKNGDRMAVKYSCRVSLKATHCTPRKANRDVLAARSTANRCPEVLAHPTAANTSPTGSPLPRVIRISRKPLVNRVWAKLLGHGLVEAEDDFWRENQSREQPRVVRRTARR